MARPKLEVASHQADTCVTQAFAERHKPGLCRVHPAFIGSQSAKCYLPVIECNCKVGLERVVQGVDQDRY